MKNSLRLLVLLLIGSISSLSIGSTDFSSTWEHLDRGHYVAGFRIIYYVDHSREWLGRGIQGRPIRIYVWFPAKHGSGKEMRVGDYIDHRTQPPLPLIFAKANELLDKRTNTSFETWLGEAAFKSFKRAKVTARMDAAAATGHFPLILYSTGLNDSFQASNSVLFEFLASNGFIVVTVPQLGRKATSLDLEIGPSDLETQTRDLEQAAGQLLEMKFPVSSECAAGHSMGAFVAMLLATRRETVRCVVGMDGSYAAPQLGSKLRQYPLFDSSAYSVPLLDLRRQFDDWDFAIFDLIKRSPVFSVQLGNMEHMSFTNDALISANWNKENRPTSVAVKPYEAIRQEMLSFLKAALGSSEFDSKRFEGELRAVLPESARIAVRLPNH